MMKKIIARHKLKPRATVPKSWNWSTRITKKDHAFEPRIFSDVKAIAQRLLEGQAAVVNFQRIDDGQAHRVVDFLSGVTFAIDGKIQRVGEKIFLCTPDDFIVEGNLTDTRQDDEFKMRGI